MAAAKPSASSRPPTTLRRSGASGLQFIIGSTNDTTNRPLQPCTSTQAHHMTQANQAMLGSAAVAPSGSSACTPPSRQAKPPRAVRHETPFSASFNAPWQQNSQDAMLVEGDVRPLKHDVGEGVGSVAFVGRGAKASCGRRQPAAAAREPRPRHCRSGVYRLSQPTYQLPQQLGQLARP